MLLEPLLLNFKLYLYIKHMNSQVMNINISQETIDGLMSTISRGGWDTYSHFIILTTGVM